MPIATSTRTGRWQKGAPLGLVELEDAKPDDLAAGCNVLLACMLEAAGQVSC